MKNTAPLALFGICLLVAVAVIVILMLGPLVGAVELGLIAALVVAGVVLILRRARRGAGARA